MKTLQRTITYDECSLAELPTEIQALIEEAKQATNSSYAPFSHFQVGAAVLLGNGKIVRGCNQENDAFPSGLCAERTALFAAGCQYSDQPVKVLAIAAQTKGVFLQNPITPCGGCAQVIYQSELRAGTPVDIYLYGTDVVYHLHGTRSILPFAFNL